MDGLKAFRGSGIWLCGCRLQVGTIWRRGPLTLREVNCIYASCRPRDLDTPETTVMTSETLTHLENTCSVVRAFMGS